MTANEPIRVSGLRVHDGDDVGTLNPLRPVHPRIVSMSRGLIAEGRFSFVGALDRTDEERANPWLLLEREQRDPNDPSAQQDSRIVPVVTGSTALATLFGGKLGADLLIVAAGTPVRLRAVATLADSILDDALVMSEQDFLSLFPSEPGYRVLLLDAPSDRVDDVQTRLAGGLAAFGGTIERSRDRLDRVLAVRRILDRLTLGLAGAGVLVAVAGLTTYTLRKP